MILVDASVLIDYLRSKDARLGGLLRTLPTAVCGVTRAELLCGVRTPADRSRLIQFLDAFHQVSTPQSTWDRIGDNLASLRSNGITVPFPDIVMATIGLDAGLECWSRDLHFSAMQSVLTGLKLFQEPP